MRTQRVEDGGHQKAITPRTAVLLSGHYLTPVLQRGFHLQQFLIEPLQADPLLALFYNLEDDCQGDATRCGVNERFGELRWVELTLEQDPSKFDFARRLEALPHWPQLLAAFNRSGVRCRHTAAHVYECLEAWAGITFLGPVLGGGHSLNEWFHFQRSYELLVAQEDKVGQRYARVVHSRLEFNWMLPHPPLSLFGRDCLWLPLGEDYYGINDRHAIMTRSHAEAYLTLRARSVMNGTILTLISGAKRARHLLTTEAMLASSVRYSGLPVCRFPPLAFLPCCSRTRNDSALRTCHNTHCYVRSRLPRLNPLAEVGGNRLSGKYLDELELAILYSHAANVTGAALCPIPGCQPVPNETDCLPVTRPKVQMPRAHLLASFTRRSLALVLPEKALPLVKQFRSGLKATSAAGIHQAPGLIFFDNGECVTADGYTTTGLPERDERTRANSRRNTSDANLSHVCSIAQAWHRTLPAARSGCMSGCDNSVSF